jgi:hypothetical protein
MAGTVVQRQLDDADKVGEDTVGVLRGPAAHAASAAPKAERVNASGLIDGGISTNVQPHAFTDVGRVGESTWHHCGGGGGKGVENLGAATLVAPVIKTKPAGKSGQAKAWVKNGTGTVKVKRSFMGVTHGVQGAFTAPPTGTVWMSPRAKDRVDKHEREHTKKSKEIHDAHIKPLEERISTYSGFFKAKKKGADEPTAQAALETELDWNTAVTDFANQDTAENTPMGPVDTNDMMTADFYADYPTKPKFQNKSGCDIYEGVGGSRRGKS